MASRLRVRTGRSDSIESAPVLTKTAAARGEARNAPVAKIASVAMAESIDINAARVAVEPTDKDMRFCNEPLVSPDWVVQFVRI